MKTVKRISALLIALTVCLIAVVPVLAATQSIESIEFSLDDSFKIYTAKNLLASSDVDGLVFAAMSESGNHQIQARRTVTDFSKQLSSFYGLDGEMIKPVGSMMFPDGYETAVINSLMYLKSTSHNDAGYTSVYVTVNNGKLYTFTYFGTDATKMGEFMTTVKLPKPTGGNRLNIYVIVLISVFIIIDIVFIAFLVISFVKDYKRHKMETSDNIVSQYVKIKRRKF